jgi:K+-sensing histidine kinase KdpD
MLIALILHAVTLTLNANRDHRGIRITTMATSNTVEICVENQCPESFGVGLGMPLVRRIVEAHGGSLTAHHLGERGFNIQITLPKLWRRSNRFRSGPATG